MLFFQTFLLLGYAYARFLTTRLRPHAQAVLHLTLVLLSLLLLPILPSHSVRFLPDAPGLGVILLLVGMVGGPYLLLAANAPLLQAWFYRRHPDRAPWPLYAVSNAASLVALLSYPILIEPGIPVKIQGMFWGIGYGLFALVATFGKGLALAPKRPSYLSLQGMGARGWRARVRRPVSPAISPRPAVRCHP